MSQVKRKNKIAIDLSDGVIGIDVSTKKHHKAILLIDFDDWIGICTDDKYGKWYAVKSGGTLYACSNIEAGKSIHIHRLINPSWDITDHINRNGLDNRRNNLRECTKSQNGMNVGRKKNNTSGHKGVWWDKRLSRWRSEIKVNYKKKYLGVYKEIDDAIVARKEAELKYFGEFA